MKKQYIQSISCFSVLVPIILFLIGLAIINITKNSFIGDFEQNKQSYINDQSLNTQIEGMKKGSAQRQANLTSWNKLLEGNSFTKINNNLRESIKDNNKSKTLDILELNKGAEPKTGVNTKSSSFDLSLVGTYTDIQNCLLNLEAKMPNLMVNSLSLEPQKNSKLINLKLNYIVWEK